MSDLAKSRLLAAFALLAACALLIPAICLSRWMSLDLDRIFDISRDWATELPAVLTPYNGSGRYFPVYWLWHAGLYGLLGASVTGFVTVQALVFCVSMALTCLLLQRMTRNRVAVAALAVLLVLNTANVEVLYTIGKAEPLAYLFLSGALVLLFRQPATSLRARVGQGAAIALLGCLAMWSKETSLILVAYAPLMMAARACIGRLTRTQGLPSWRRELLPLAATLGGVLLSRLPHLLMPRTNDAAAYTTYTIGLDTVWGNIQFYLLQQPDIIATALVSLATFIALARRLARRDVTLQATDADALALSVSLWCMAAAYYAVLAVWQWPMAYYPYFPSIAFKVSCVGGLWLLGRLGGQRGATRWLAHGVLAIGVLYAAVYARYIGASQIDYSAVYTQALQTFDDTAAPGARLIIETYPFYAEQMRNANRYLPIMRGHERTVQGISDLLNPPQRDSQLMRMLKIADQDPALTPARLPQAGDYLLAFTGDKLATWFLRGVAPFYQTGSVLEAQDMYTMHLVAEDRRARTDPFVHIWSHRPALQETALGFKLYRVDAGPRWVWSGRYLDNWIGQHAELRLFKSDTSAFQLGLNTLRYNAPVKVRIACNTGFSQELTLAAEVGQTLVLHRADDVDPTVCTIDASHTFSPQENGFGNDPRQLSVTVTLAPAP